MQCWVGSRFPEAESPPYLLPGLYHTGGICQNVDVLVLVVLVDLGSRLEERLHEQVQEGRHPDLRRAHSRVGWMKEALAYPAVGL